MLLRNLHLIVGALGLIIFALQGQYMAHVLELSNLEDTQRMLYRSAHIYFMAACAANICIGYYQSVNDRTTLLQGLSSILILLSPGFLLFSFFTESGSEGIERPIITLGLYALFGGAAVLGTGAIMQRFRRD